MSKWEHLRKWEHKRAVFEAGYFERHKLDVWEEERFTCNLGHSEWIGFCAALDHMEAENERLKEQLAEAQRVIDESGKLAD